MSTGSQYNGLEIAIIGMSSGFPGSSDHRQFWQNLQAGHESITFFSKEEMRALGVDETLLSNELYVPSCGAIVEDKDCFDPAFFGYTAEEAAMMDPQIRAFHQHCWSAIEDAGYASQVDQKKIGLFGGASSNGNWQMYAYARSGKSEIDPLYRKMITNAAFVNTLTAYKLNLRGPAVFVDSACSTSLVAIHLACRSLLTRECAIALAGAVSIKTIHKKGYLYEAGKIASHDGHCRTFDAASSGTSVGEGTGVVVLKRLQEAIKDKDAIYAIIKSTSVNNDGGQKPGYTTPGVKGQSECIRAAHKLANVSPDSISYIEAHGTATRLGDPVEVRALNEAFATGGADKFCAIGSVKTNIGHLDTAAGVAGLIKTALSLQHRQLPPSLHFEVANPEIDFAGGPFYVNTSLQDWVRRGDWPLRAGVSSFGIGGTNAHVILEEAPAVESSDAGPANKLLTVSARTAQSVKRYLEKLQHFLSEEPDLNLGDLCYTLQTGRKAFGYRCATVFRDRADLLDQLSGGRLAGQVRRSADRSVGIVFLFSGQGSQYAGMGRDLYEQDAVFRAYMDKGFSLLQSLTGEDHRSILYGEEGGKINQTKYTQPLLFLLEYALSMWLGQLGIVPRYMLGHSLGEYTAACVSGVIAFEQCLELVVRRGACMNAAQPGSMVSISLSEAAVQVYLQEGLSLAAVNGPEQVVLSGELAAIDRLTQALEADAVVYRVLHTSHAFHSAMMEEAGTSFLPYWKHVSIQKATIPFISNVTGGFIGASELAHADYWVRQMREGVQFSKGLQTILQQGSREELVFVEVGAGQSLISLLKQQPVAELPAALNLVRGIREQADDLHYLTNRIGQLWSSGVPVNWTSWYEGQQRRKVSLPTYSFEPVKYPTEVDPVKSYLQAGINIGFSDNKSLKDWVYHPLWKRTIFCEKQVVTSRVYLLFGADGALGESLKRHLADADGSCRVLEALVGDGFYQEGNDRYTINPTDPGQFDRLLEAVRAQGIVITDIVYGWGMGIDPHKTIVDETNAGGCRLFFSLVWLVQALLRSGTLKEKRIAVLTTALHKVLGNESGDHGQSLLLGLVNVLPQEYSVTCFNIDLPMEAQGEPLWSMLADEIRGNVGARERMVALRNGQRWIQEFQKNTRSVVSGQKIRPGGIYLITGGLGNVGFVIGKYLLERYGVTLVLTGRRSLLSLKQEAAAHFQALTAISDAVHYFQADVADAVAFEQVVQAVETQLGAIHGIVHAAGVIDDHFFELVEDITPARAKTLLAPKVTGIENIYSIFGHRTPDFVWFTSSLSTVLGGLGFCAYAAANSYMDHFLLSRSGELPNWRGVGLGDMVFHEKDIRRETGTTRSCLRPDEIIELFEWSLGPVGTPLLIQTIEELSSRIYRVFEVKKDVYLDEVVNEAVPEKAERPRLSSQWRAAQTETEKRTTELFEQFFGITGLGIDDNFFELGGDSLKAMMLLKRIRNAFDINITLTDFFQHEHPGALAGFIDQVAQVSARTARTGKKMLI
ncbi:type I polyketide synthase [Paraflavitalea pollutisoli]|uniref:type I polyketide synthase n=1 Tax=Paraflavitalea pollutisoli TaxID=3034143 RepID=UPI0023EDB53C|nr:type I polyketide synthase [Paraflavitalea sp. H1-2-19X]